MNVVTCGRDANEMCDAETEMRPRSQRSGDSDKTETRRRSDGIETRPRCSINVSSPSRDRDVQDRDYNPDMWPRWTDHTAQHAVRYLHVGDL